ncbi:MAG: alanine--glyoxylate aminotransferase family protein [Caldimicrobium sp.]|nr:alanine--glyoxylate aminotransferase family protein [Caldimicrobium sp.]MCX7613020.1 alanine--glyoxylate aminotransferase family protein [Caldimicrobium sp.]MDW8182277.1 alanine--glyoxylate aminotransferase family protein [Caldimicrobium sp.]
MDFLGKRYLFTPGPVPVSPRVLLTQAQPITHHRLPEFSEILREIREGLKYLFQTKEEVYFFASSGTGAMEAAIVNLFSPGDKVIVVEAGKFGERWRELAETYRLHPVVISLDWGRAVKPEMVEEVLRLNPDAKAILIQACETSTGVKHPVEEIAKLLRDKETLLVVDAITALGVYPLPMDEWGLDVVIAGSQKGLSLPPGLSFVAFSQKAKKVSQSATLPRYYFNLQKEAKAYQKDTTAYTPAVSLLLGLREMLRRIRELGLDFLHRHSEALSLACREAVLALGLELFPEIPSQSLTVIKAPSGLNTGEFLRHLRDRWGIVFAGGQDQLKGRIIRITHMGDQTAFDLMIAISSLELGLKLFGVDVPLGAGVKRVEEVIFDYLKER